MRKIVAISGLISSGKDSAAQYLIANHNFTKLSFAGTLKDVVSIIFGWDRQLVEGETKESRQWREEIDGWWAQRLNIPQLTPRWVLQHWGTEVCRNSFHNDIWVAALENKIHQTSGNIVITDARFINELMTVKNMGGHTIRISRGPNPDWYEHAVKYNRGEVSAPPEGVHASEYSSVGLDFDYYVDNNSTLADLHQRIESVINL